MTLKFGINVRLDCEPETLASVNEAYIIKFVESDICSINAPWSYKSSPQFGSEQ